jgi:lipopolysaccharide/colanic/teichoic acid biosynthesis glycosyltransferase
VARGDFAWVGNRPLTPAETADLTTDYERLWLSVPPGLFSLADAMGCREPFGDEARAHASFFAVDPTPHKQARILARLLRRVFMGAPKPGA